MVDSAIERPNILFPLLLFTSNCLFVLRICNIRTIETLKPCVLPEHNGLFVRVITSFSYVINKILDVSHTNFTLFVFLFCFFTLSKIYSYALTHTHISNCRSTSTLDPIDTGSAIAHYDFENLIYQDEDEGEEDCEVPGELARLLQQEEGLYSPMKSQLRQ